MFYLTLTYVTLGPRSYIFLPFLILRSVTSLYFWDFCNFFRVFRNFFREIGYLFGIWGIFSRFFSGFFPKVSKIFWPVYTSMFVRTKRNIGKIAKSFEKSFFFFLSFNFVFVDNCFMVFSALACVRGLPVATPVKI